MHEYSVAENIVSIALDEAQKAKAVRITGITLVVGDLSPVLDRSVQMYFDLISEGTAASGALLVFKRQPARFRCPACGYEYDRPERGFACPRCGNQGIYCGGGRDFYIESMEVES